MSENETNAIVSLQYHGKSREAALNALHYQLRQWNISPPPMQPLVLDFGLDDWRHVGLIEMWICNEVRAGYCGKYIFVQNGQQCPTHSHQIKHETYFLLQGQLKVVADSKERLMRPGDTAAIPVGQKHSFEGYSGPALLLELSMPCNPLDNHFEDKRINNWLTAVIGH